MTNEQKEALYRVRASYSNFEYSGFDTGAYRTEDMEAVLDILEELEQKLECVKDDLDDIRGSLQMSDDVDKVTLELVESTMALLEDVEE